MPDPITLALGAWGALLSTVLAAIRIWELARKGPKLAVRYHFTSLPEEGHTITIENFSETPAMISYWQLVWATRRRGGYIEKQKAASPDARHEIKTITILPHETHAMRFADEDYFGWGIATRPMGQLYLKLFVPGRKKPRWMFVYDPSAPVS
jgi:hypothetical protein